VSGARPSVRAAIATFGIGSCPQAERCSITHAADESPMIRRARSIGRALWPIATCLCRRIKVLSYHPMLIRAFDGISFTVNEAPLAPLAPPASPAAVFLFLKTNGAYSNNARPVCRPVSIINRERAFRPASDSNFWNICFA